MDFTPRYLREDDTGSWLSDNSAAATVEVHSDPGTKLMMIRMMDDGDVDEDVEYAELRLR